MLVVLLCLMGWLVTGLGGAILARRTYANLLIYGVTTALCVVAGVDGLVALSAPSTVLTLPLGLPWIGAHVRLDALAAFFLFVVNLGGVGASVYALGYGRHERASERVLPFYPVFLAGLSLVVIADDAFTFLFAWELMSLASWALVVSHHHGADNVRAGYAIC